MMRPCTYTAVGLFAALSMVMPVMGQAIDTALIPATPREFRAAWVATVDNIDWPSRKGLSSAAQQAELTAILDRAEQLRLNALVFQVRPACDTLYPSKLEPWSEWLTGRQGQGPSPAYDPLQFLIDGCRERGLELHAWFNPYRARHSAARSPVAADHVSQTRPSWVRSHGDQLWLDPGEEGAANHTLAVILDVLRRYDVDGIHIDDYFYPYPIDRVPFPDQSSHQAYRRAGGELARDDWRRDNVDRLVRRIYRAIKAEKPHVKFGISPFGIVRPGVPAGVVAGLDQFASLHADVELWIKNGWYDYLAPQLYWRIDSPQPYGTLLRYYALNNPHGRHVWVGNYVSQLRLSKDPWPVSEILRQVEMTRQQPGVLGNIHFSMRPFLEDRAGIVGALTRGPYRRAAAVPASPWLKPEPPPPPSLTVSRDAQKAAVLHFGGDEARWFVLHVRSGGQWILADILPGLRSQFVLSESTLTSAAIDAVAISTLDRCGNESQRTATQI